MDSYLGNWVYPHPDPAVGLEDLLTVLGPEDFADEEALIAHLSERLWIDDLSQTAVGPRRHVTDVLDECIVAAQEQFELQSLRLSPKSIITCTDISDAKARVKRLRWRGVEVQWGRQMTHLGVDLGSGKRLARQTRTARMRASKVQHLKVKRFAMASRRFRILKKI